MVRRRSAGQRGARRLHRPDGRQRVHQVQAVHQRALGLRGVDYGADATQLGHGQHIEQQFGAVFDKHRHHVTLAHALPLLSIICVIGAGYEEVDLQAASNRGIKVTNAAGANQTTAASQELSRLAVDLNTMIAKFVV